MPRYLSAAWFDAAIASVAGAGATGDTVTAVAALGVTQVVEHGPDGTVTFHVSTPGPGGGARFGIGPAEPEHVRLRTDWTTALGVARGELSAQQAFIDGRIVVTGDAERLVGAGDLLAAVAVALAPVRAATTYDPTDRGAAAG